MKIVKRQLSAIKTFTLLTFVSLTLVVAGFAQGKLNIADQVSLVTEFEVNGLKVLVKKRSNSPTVAAGIYVKGGASNIIGKNSGIESMTLQSATDGSKKYSRDVVRRELASTGSQIGASVNNDYSVLSFISTRQYFDKTWDIFSDLAINPTFEKDDVERNRQQFLTGLREQETDNDNFLDVLQGRIVYAKHPYANNVNGTIETIQKFTPQQLRAYHKSIMQTSQLLLVVVGDIDANVLKKKLESTFGKLPKGIYKAKTLPKFDFSKATLDVTSRNVPTNYIRGIFNAPAIDNPDYYPMRVAMTILSGKLFEEVRQRRQLTYTASATLDAYLTNTANIYVTTTDANQAVKVMLDEVKNMKREQETADTIKNVAGFFLTNYYIQNETNLAQVGELAKYEIVGGSWRNSFEFLNGVQSVTPQQVQDVSKKYMKNMRFVVIGNPIIIDKKIFLQDLSAD